MRGLLMKDLQLMKVNKRMLFIIVALAVVMLVMGNSMNSFVIGYVTLVFAFQVLTTITYDEYDQSGAFLMTMPVTRMLYTLEKYVFAFLSMALGWGGVVVLSAVFQLVSKTDRMAGGSNSSSDSCPCPAGNFNTGAVEIWRREWSYCDYDNRCRMCSGSISLF